MLRKGARGETLVATAPPGLGRSSPVEALANSSDGFVACRRRGSALLIDYASPAFQSAVSQPSSSFSGLELAELLHDHLSDAAREELATRVAQDQPAIVEVAFGDRQTARHLAVTPTPIRGLWVGSLVEGPVHVGGRDQPSEPSQLGATTAPSGRGGLNVSPVVAKILDATRSLVAIKDGDGRYVLVNAPMTEFHGLRRADFIGHTAAEIGIARPPEAAASNGESVEPMVGHDVELTDATGRRRRFDVAYHVAHAPEGDTRYRIEVATETFAEAPRRAAAAAVPLLATISVAAFRWTLDPDLTITRIDDAAEHLFGNPANELVGDIDKLLGYAVDRDTEARRARWRTLVAESQPLDEELAIVDALGATRWLRVVAKSSSDNPREYDGLIADVTTTKQAQARLVDAEKRLELALANGGLGLVDWQIESDRLLPNRELANLLELPNGEYIDTATRLSGFEHPKDRPRIHSELVAHLHGRTTEFHSEYRVTTARGRVRWVLASGRVIERTPDGRALRYIGTLQDVTGPLETEQRLEKHVANSQAAARVSSELTREVRQLEAQIREISDRERERIGHDLHDGLGQELTGASLLLKTLEQGVEREAPQFNTKVRAVRDMVEQCIATTRALAQGLSPVHLDRDGFAGALGQLAATSEAFYGIQVKFNCQRNGISPAPGAAMDFYRIAQEAISNAAKHSGATEIKLRLFADVDRIAVTVEDNGRGLPPGAEQKGGMGLKIMRYRATIIGASLEITSGEAGGTIVRCTLRHPVEKGLA